MTLDLQKLSAAKLWLISTPAAPQGSDAPRDLPYLASALYALIPVESPAVRRISADEWWRIYVNARWLDGATVAEVGAELAHLVWHLLADHAGRARDLNVDLTTVRAWDAAADVTISHTLTPDALRPDHLTTAADAALRPGLTAEQYYALITGLPIGAADARGSVGPTEGCGSAADGIHRSHEHRPDSDLGVVASFDATEIRRRVAIEYRDVARTRGTGPGDALRWTKETLEPRTPWEPLLAGSVRRGIGWATGRGDYTYARPSRRASSVPGIVLPGQRRPVPRLAIVVDTSASVDDHLLARALGEIDGAIAALGVPSANVTVYTVDDAVHTVGKVRRSRDVRLVGAGGTDLRVGIAKASAERPRPDVIIVLTDGDTPWPSAPPPSTAVIAAILGRDRRRLPLTPRWAMRVECVVD